MRNSLTLRLALSFGLASTAVLIAIGALVGVAVERHFVELDRAELDAKRDLVRHVLAKIRSPAELGDIGRIDEALVGQMDAFVRITDPDGKLVYQARSSPFPPVWLSPANRIEPTAADELATWEQDGHLFRGIRAVAPTEMDTPPLSVALGINIDHHRAFMHAFNRALWAAIGLGILSTALLGWVAARRGLAPVAKMAAVARNITASRLRDRLEVEQLPVELVDLASSFNAMLARLEDSFRRLTEFSSDLAHELRTPISSLMTQTQVALSRSRSADEYREVLYSNVEEFDRLARMIADMLFLAKADNGLLVPRSEAVDLASEVRDLFDYYDALVEERGVQLTVNGEGSVCGERLMIRRAIGNLLSNAVNHSTRGGCVSVRIDNNDDTGDVLLSVENRGDTVPPEHLPRLFDRFYRVDPARQRLSEGAGLGLAITKSIVTAHRGRVQAFSADGVTRVEMLLPAAPNAAHSGALD